MQSRMFRANDLDLLSTQALGRLFPAYRGMLTSLVLIAPAESFLPAVPKKISFPSSGHYCKVLLNSRLAFCNNNIHIVRTDTFLLRNAGFLPESNRCRQNVSCGNENDVRESHGTLTNGF